MRTKQQSKINRYYFIIAMLFVTMVAVIVMLIAYMLALPNISETANQKDCTTLNGNYGVFKNGADYCIIKKTTKVDLKVYSDASVEQSEVDQLFEKYNIK